MNQWLAIAAGGAVGAVGRFWISSWVNAGLGKSFPYGTLVVNVLGSLVMGILFVLLVEKVTTDPIWRSLLMVGLLGAFTTFSTFSLETLQLLESGALLRAGLNMLVSVVICVLAAWAGMFIGRQLI